jgi:transcriptional regulator of aromatic amino acid metabolism
MIDMENPTRSNLIGKVQVRVEEIGKARYVDKGEVALWTHNDSKYLLRGYVTIDGTRYLVSLTENGE